MCILHSQQGNHASYRKIFEYENNFSIFFNVTIFQRERESRPTGEGGGDFKLIQNLNGARYDISSEEAISMPVPTPLPSCFQGPQNKRTCGQE